MIGERMQDAINAQIKEEMESAYLYLSMVGYFESIGLEGMAQWMKAQVQEEVAHAMRFFDHLVERDGRVKLLALAEPKTEWSSPLDAFQAALAHEEYITGKISDLVTLAAEENDHAAAIMLQWFVSEQVEEEATASRIVDLLARIGTDGPGLVMVDRELGARVPMCTPAPADSDGE
ncbi:MAG: ferritin [Candidatus Bipolaricaulota bacterium]|nr:MAG: ferritin [Candidatus Bipolaricaulota bacterium]